MRIHVYVRGLNHPLTFTGTEETEVNRYEKVVEIENGTILDGSGQKITRAVFERHSIVGVVECPE